MGFDGIRRHLTIGESGPPLSETWFLARPNSLGSDALCLCNNDHMWEQAAAFVGSETDLGSAPSAPPSIPKKGGP